MAFYVSGKAPAPKPIWEQTTSQILAGFSDPTGGVGLIAPLAIVSPFTKIGSPAEKLISKLFPSAGKAATTGAATTIKIVDKSKTVLPATGTNILRTLAIGAGGVGGGVLLATLLGNKQSSTQTQAPQNPTQNVTPAPIITPVVTPDQSTTTNTITKYIYTSGGGDISGGSPTVSPEVTPTQTTPIYISVPTTATQPTTQTQESTQKSDNSLIMIIAIAAAAIGIMYVLGRKK